MLGCLLRIHVKEWILRGCARESSPPTPLMPLCVLECLSRLCVRVFVKGLCNKSFAFDACSCVRVLLKGACESSLLRFRARECF